MNETVHLQAPAGNAFLSNIEAEQEVLGLIMMNNEDLHKVSGFLRPEYFAQPVHQRIYEKCLDLTARGGVANAVTLKAVFENDADLEEVGGVRYLAHLTSSTLGLRDGLKFYAQVIFDCYQKRELITISEGIKGDAEGRDTSGAEQIENALGAIMEITGQSSSEMGTAKSAFDNVLEEIREIQAGSAVRLSTGLRSLDKALNGGLRPGQLIILAGRPSMGKTTLAINIAANCAKRNEAGLVFSLEMTSSELMVSIIARETAIDSKKIITGDLSAHEMAKIEEKKAAISDYPIFIDDSGAMSIDAITSRAHGFAARHNIRYIIVDHMQRMRSPFGMERANRTLSLGQSAQGLKNLAKALQVPVIVLSQLNRGVEGRDDKRPLLSDLRESGEIEQEADVVGLLYRHAYYLSREEGRDEDHALWAEQMKEWQNMAEIDIAKNRSGTTGRVKLHFRPEHLLFAERY